MLVGEQKEPQQTNNTARYVRTNPNHSIFEFENQARVMCLSSRSMRLREALYFLSSDKAIALVRKLVKEISLKKKKNTVLDAYKTRVVGNPEDRFSFLEVYEKKNDEKGSGACIKARYLSEVFACVRKAHGVRLRMSNKFDYAHVRSSFEKLSDADKKVIGYETAEGDEVIFRDAEAYAKEKNMFLKFYTMKTIEEARTRTAEEESDNGILRLYKERTTKQQQRILDKVRNRNQIHDVRVA